MRGILAHPAIYNLSQRTLGRNYRLQRRVMEAEGFPGEGRAVLDVACGTGALFPLLSRGGSSNYLGVDLDARYVAHARKNFGPHFEVMDATSLALSGRRFPRVMCCGLFHHLDTEQSRAVLRGIRDLLTPDGEVLVIDPAWPSSSWNALGRALCRSDRGEHIRKRADYATLLGRILPVKRSYAMPQWPYEYSITVLGAARKSTAHAA